MVIESLPRATSFRHYGFYRHMQKISLFLLPLAFYAVRAAAQNPADSLRQSYLEPVSISASRLETKDFTAPLAVTVLDRTRLQTGQTMLSPFEALTAVPGVFPLNPDNYAQDLRISIRGFGARSAFGIRGIKVLVDGIPESTADGQADVDNLDLGVIRQMEVTRGPASGLYGNAAGGVLSFSTDAIGGPPSLTAQTTWGSYGLQRHQLKAIGRAGKWAYLASGTHLRADGYRAQSQMRNTIAMSKIQFAPNAETKITLLLNYANSPVADDPGGLTLTDANANRRQARQANADFDGGEVLEQGRAALLFERQWGSKHQVQGRGFYTARNFSSRLAFQNGGWVELRRGFGGGGVSYQFADGPYRLKTGVEVEDQRDERLRFDNLRGEKGQQTFNQIESFRSVGAYALQELKFWRRVELSVNTRYDQMWLSASDRFLSNGDQSGQRGFGRLNPMIGLAYGWDKVRLYGSFTTSFESPSLSELSNNPTGEGGFAALNPQRARNMEIGTKALLFKKLRAEIALFHIAVTDELVPYQTPAFPGRVFFRNAGASARQGVECGLTYAIAPGLTAFATYTYSDFLYSDYQVNTANFDGKQLPGIPRHAGYLEARYERPKGAFGIVQIRHVGALFADDANTTPEKAYQVVQLRGGYVIKRAKWRIEPFLGVNNLLNAVYFANIQLNAAAGRFYEPAANRTFFGGVKCVYF